MVLWQRVWKLHERADEEGPDAATAARLGLERIRVRHGAVVQEGKLAEPIEEAVCRRRAESSAADAFSQRREAGLLIFEGRS